MLYFMEEGGKKKDNQSKQQVSITLPDHSNFIFNHFHELYIYSRVVPLNCSVSSYSVPEKGTVQKCIVLEVAMNGTVRSGQLSDSQTFFFFCENMKQMVFFLLVSGKSSGSSSAEELWSESSLNTAFSYLCSKGQSSNQ